jgi:hypothetical protein
MFFSVVTFCSIKLGQLMQLFSSIEAFEKKFSPKYQVGICCCGDYNLHPDSFLYNWILNGGGKLSEFDGRYASGQERKPSSQPVQYDEWRGYSKSKSPRGGYSSPQKFSDSKQESIVNQLLTWDSTLNGKGESPEKKNILKHGLKLKTSCTYSHTQMTTVHNGHKGGGCVDYIFYNSTLTYRACLSLPAVKSVVNILSKAHPSDHIPLKVEFILPQQSPKSIEPPNSTK